MSDILLSSVVQGSRACVCGLGIHASLSLASTILSGRISKVLKYNPVNPNCLKFGAFLGGFAGVYRLARDLLQRYQILYGQGKNSSYIALAAALAGLTSAIQPAHTRHTIMLLLASRALASLLKRWQAATGLRIPSAVFLAMVIVNSTILVQTSLQHPDALPPSYYKSIQRWSCVYNDTNITQIFRPCPDQSERLTCHEVIHPGQSCLQFSLLSTAMAWKHALKLYMTLSAIPLVFRAKQLLKTPAPMLARMAKTVARSTAYLGVSCTIGFSTICAASRNKYIRQNFNTPQGRLPDLVGLLIGLAMSIPAAIEPASRWYELAMYTTPLTLHLIIRHMQLNHLIPTTRNSSVFFFAAAMAVIMQAYERQQKTIPTWLASFLRYLVH
eukprot:scpid60213/ scgid18117/ 